MEYQAVIMAAGRGSRMTDLTCSTPKALLPIANMPMIWYPIKTLEKAGFEEAIVIVQKNHQMDIQKTLMNIGNVKLRLDFVPIPPTEDWGTADSLRHIKDKIKADVLVMSCDVLTDVPIHHLADTHRIHDATITLLLSPLIDTTDLVAPGGGKASKKMEKDLIGLNKDGQKVSIFASEADFEENVTFKKSFFKKNPFVKISTRLLDGHVYILKHTVMDVIIQHDKMSAFKGEVLPYIVKQQCGAGHASKHQDSTGVEDMVGSGDNEMERCALEMSTHASVDGTVCGEELCCYAYSTNSEEFCLRANTVLTYCEANRQVQKRLSSIIGDEELVAHIHPTVTKHQKSQVGHDSMVGEGSTIAEKAGIKRSILGRHCNVGERAKITNCIVMDHVTIEKEAVLSGCIICQNAHIGEKTELKDCLVGNSQAVMALGKFSNDVIVDTNQMMEI